MSRRKDRTADSPTNATPRVARPVLLTGAVLIAGAVVASTLPASMQPAHIGAITVWHSPTHRCCIDWVAYLWRKRYRVIVNHVEDVIPVKADLGVPAVLYSCHTAKIDHYIIEGHVPAPAVSKLLDKRPELKGIAVPGMPSGPPGMGGTPGIYRVTGFTADGGLHWFADVGI
jgi:hypothetical protein